MPRGFVKSKACQNTAMADALFRAGIGIKFPKPPPKVDNPEIPRSAVDATILQLQGHRSSLLRRRDRAMMTLREMAEKVVAQDQIHKLRQSQRLESVKHAESLSAER